MLCIALFWCKLYLHFIYNPPILTPSPPVQVCKGAQQPKDLLCYKKVKSRSQAANAGNCIQGEPWFDTSGYWIVEQSLFSGGTHMVFLS